MSPRTKATARKAGTAFETLIADYLNETVDDRIERRAKNGANDRGDISGVRALGGGRVVLQCKDYGGRYEELAQWMRAVETQRGNDDAMVGALVIKRQRHGRPEDQTVVMTLADLVALLKGQRGHGDE